MDTDQLNDYRERCLRRAADLREMADQADLDGRPSEAHRLSGKAQGLDLAVDYLRGYGPAADDALRADLRDGLTHLAEQLAAGDVGEETARHLSGVAARLLARLGD